MGEEVVLGQRYRDSVTGFEGVATARIDYLFGCVRYVLEGQDHDGEPAEHVFDEQRLVTLEGQLVEPLAVTGGSRGNPARRKNPAKR